MKHRKLPFIYLLLIFSVFSAQAEDLSRLNMPLFDTMHGMTTEWVAEKMVYNGHPMSIQNYKANRSAKDVMRHFESKWKVKGHGRLNHQRVGDDLTIGFEHNGYSYSIQARDVPGGSVGSLVVTRNKKFNQAVIKFPMHPDAHVVSRIHSVDMGIKSETITISSYHSVIMNQQWYRSALLRNGWKGQKTMLDKKGLTLEYQKGNELCQLTFMDKSPVREHRSMVMVHWIKG